MNGEIEHTELPLPQGKCVVYINGKPIGTTESVKLIPPKDSVSVFEPQKVFTYEFTIDTIKEKWYVKVCRWVKNLFT